MRIFKTFCVFIIAGLLLLSNKTFSQDPNFYIYLCFGQSNMEGQGTIEAQDKTVNSRLQVLQSVTCSNLNRTKGKWYKAIPPLTRCWSGLSPADYFGRTMVENLPDSIRIGIVNVSVAGCKIELYDKDGYTTYVNSITETWLKNIIAEYNGNPYQYLVDMAKLAQKDGVIKGILLHQGESNTGDTQWPAKVKKIYNNLLTDLNLKSDSVPLLAGEVVHADQGGICASMNTIINRLPQTIPTSYVISSSKCTDANDNLHFNSAGYRELGKRYAKKMLQIMGYTGPLVGTDEFMFANGYSLEQNFPNPVSGETLISFEIPAESFVSLKVFNTAGIEIKELAGKKYPAGKHSATFHSNEFPEGIYIYTLKTNDYTGSRKMIIGK